MPKRILLCSLLAAAVALSGFSQDKPKLSPVPSKTTVSSGAPGLTADLFSLSFDPGATIPMFGDGSFFNLGGGADLGAQLKLPFFPMAYVGVDLGYMYSPIRRVTSLSVLDGGLEAGIGWEMIPNLVLKAFAGGGYFFGFLNDGSGTNGSNPYVSGGVGASYFVTDNLSLGLKATYRYLFGLYNGIDVALGSTYRFGAPAGGGVQSYGPGGKPSPLSGGKPGTGLDLSSVTLSDVYPVFYKYYDDHPIGTAVLHNAEKSDATNVAVSIFVKEYMDNPKIIQIPGKIPGGSDMNVDLYGLFTREILKNSEATKVSAAINVTYTVNGKNIERDHVETLRVLDRNSLTWDDNRKAAAFVSAKDPTAMLFAKNVQSIVSGKADAALDPALLTAMAIHDALTLYRLTYSSDPIATYTTNKAVADYIQFPQQTLQYRGGKCSDFSVLYASMFEALGVESAFITIPGHIYVAVALQMNPDDARRFFSHPDDLIFQNNKAWVPIEITLREGGFMKAWQLGAKEWRENQALKTADFYPIHDAWQTFEPVGYSGTAADIKVPEDDKVASAYASEVRSFVNAEIGTQEAALKAEAAKAQNKSKALNSLAILYGRFGLYDRATKQLQDIIAKDEFVPALVNLGNIYFVKGDMDNALKYYNRAYKKAPTNATVLLCVARASHAEENYATAKKAYAELKVQDPALAERFAYLDLRGEEATRAADASQLRKVVVWDQQ